MLLTLSSASAQQSGFSLKGVINDESGNGIMASISIHELGIGTLADLDGNFSFKNLRPGSYHLHVTHVGFKSENRNIIIRENDSEVSIKLKESAIELESLTIEANPFKNGPLEQSQTILVLDRDFLERNNGGTFANALEKLPGISTINTGVGIAKPVIRGMSFNRIMINDRGIKQEGQQWGADHGLEIDPFDVDRVEVVKGPASLLYGSDGMAGVINISPPAFKQDNEIEASFTSMYRTNNDMLSNSLAIDGNEGDILFGGRFTAQDFADYRVPATQFNYAGFILPINENRLKNTAGRERHFSAMAGVKKAWGYSTLTVSRFDQEAGIFAGAVGVPNSYNLRHDGDHRNIDVPRQSNQHLKVLWNNSILLGSHWLELDLGYQKNERREFSRPHTQEVGPDNPFGNLALSLTLDVFTANARINKQHGDKGQSIIGFNTQYSENQQSGFEFLLPNFQSFQGGAFYFREYRYSDKLIFNAGARLDGAYHDIQEHLQPIFERLRPTGDMDQRNPDIQRQFFNASASTGLSWVFKENFNLKLNLGSAYRIPTPIELSSNGVHHGNFRHEVGNANLDRERSYQADMNFAYSKKNFLITVSPFFGYYDSYIYLSPAARFSPLPGSSIIWEYRQNNAIFTGGELRTTFHPIKSLSLSLGTEYVYNRNLDTGLPLPLTPPFSILSGLEYKVPQITQVIENLYLFVEIRKAADQNRVDRNERITEGYTLLEAGLGGDFQIAKQEVKFQVSGQNLTNAVYFNHLSRYRLLNLPEQGRNISFSLKIPLQVRNRN
ncbi:TonB-dependent receptor [Indibacter alkaliphilus LW1]|uniref:TonB-dependent receptor n=1 Tax=Indibacter alkaliphilus (strain CCUG 57479 / KCTC 22604 / LW1) TaxID=1189612 RepID=S2DHY2_INDAL|nr:TonB-dependent receptor [Indibacter alkaliphilus]EOZ98617.1 TonB-dependent receptor [Indibacter alkaliphilus LW1]